MNVDIKVLWVFTGPPPLLWARARARSWRRAPRATLQEPGIALLGGRRLGMTNLLTMGRKGEHIGRALLQAHSHDAPTGDSKQGGPKTRCSQVEL